MRHAYCIEAHNDFSILEKIFRLLDDEKNDFYIHVDKKSKIDKRYFENILKKSTVKWVKRHVVSWGGYSQIRAELKMFSSAYEVGYDYYHLISGVDMPIKSLEFINDFFERNKGFEFVTCDVGCDYMKNSGLDERFKYYWFWRDVRLPSLIKGILETKTRQLQKKLRVDRYREKYEYGYGANWCSLTHKAIQKILEQKKWIRKTYRFTSCCDEIYKQTIIHKAGLPLYPKGDLRFIIFEPGKNGPITYTMADYNMLMESDKLWARKFSTQIDKQVIEKIYETLIGEGDAG